MYLVDNNVWLERLLDQGRSEEGGHFLDHLPSGHLFVTDFAFYSIGVALSRPNHTDVLLRFVQDAFVDGAVGLIHLDPGDTERLVYTMEQFNLDFDDAYQYAYQYVAAEKHNLTLVSFDSDFDRTERGRKNPAQVLRG